mgnify:CR=1 FL=1
MKARLPRGFGGGAPGNMQQMLKQAQKVQQDMAAKQAELEEREFTTTAGGGVVEVVINGRKELQSLNLKPEIVDPEDVAMLEDLIMAAVNQAIRMVEETTAAEMEKLTGGLGLPGML